MSTLNPQAYRKLIQEDIDWLKTINRTLERDHIIVILEMELVWWADLDNLKSAVYGYSAWVKREKEKETK